MRLLGRLSDEYGRRPILLVSIGGTILGFVLLALAEPLGVALGGAIIVANTAVLTMLFISRILDGLTGGNISVAQAYISDISTPENRNKALGIVGAAFGLGFIIGPAVGGLLIRAFWLCSSRLGGGRAGEASTGSLSSCGCPNHTRTPR